MDEIQNNQMIIYQTESGDIKVDVLMQDETMWLSLNQIAQVFDRDKSVVSRHIANIFREEELEKSLTVAKYATVQTEGEREVQRQVEYYNLDMILSVGYRVNSKLGVKFRKWASNVLKEYLIKGYSINQQQITENNFTQLKQTIELLSATLIKQGLISDVGKDLLDIITAYNKTWDILVRYDEDNLSTPDSLKEANSNLLDYQEAIKAIARLKASLGLRADSLFGQEREEYLKGILGNIDQTFDGRALYKSAIEKAAHLLYFIIKDHPFVDGNKRIASLLFLLYLSKAKVGQNIEASSMTAMALLVSESEPKQKDLIIKLIINLIS